MKLLNILAERLVANAADRTADRLYHRGVSLPAVPPVGSHVRIGKRLYTVDRLYFADASAAVRIVLVPEHRTFKGGDFAAFCKTMEDDGFLWTPGENRPPKAGEV